MHSCIYSGAVRHRRFHPVTHEFRYSLFQMYLDLTELPELFDPYLLWSARRTAVAWFRRDDHLGDEQEPLDISVRNEVRRQTGVRPDGPIRLLTNLRFFGYVINPVSYFYCFSAATNRLEFVLAEVHNTPWGERHCYVLSAPVNQNTGAAQSVWSDKRFHVSPFMSMNMQYQWHISEPADRLSLHLKLHSNTEPDNTETMPFRSVAGKRPLFDVTLLLRREEVNSASLARSLLRHPCITAKAAAAIYWQALRLWLKRVPFVTHPARLSKSKRSIPLR